MIDRTLIFSRPGIGISNSAVKSSTVTPAPAGNSGKMRLK